MAKTAKSAPVKVAKKSVKKTVSTTAKIEKPVKVTTKKSATEVMKSEVQGLVATVVGVDGKASGKMTLPAELFAEKINEQLMAQAVRVYLANQREGGANTKTRGEVEGNFPRRVADRAPAGRARRARSRATRRRYGRRPARRWPGRCGASPFRAPGRSRCPGCAP